MAQSLPRQAVYLGSPAPPGNGLQGRRRIHKEDMMQQLIVSMMRLSAAATLFGMEQIQHSMEVLEGNEDISKMMRRFAKTLDSVSDAFAGGIDARKRDTLKSITRASEQIVEKSVDGLTLIDPREPPRD